MWKSKVSPMQFEYVNGAQIVFRGLDDALKQKAIKPEKIVLNDSFTGRTSAGTSMEEALEAMENPLANLIYQVYKGKKK